MMAPMQLNDEVDPTNITGQNLMVTEEMKEASPVPPIIVEE